MLKHIGSNWTLSGLQLVAMMWLTPFILDELGSGPNGVWVTIVSLTGFLSLFVMGVPMSTVKHIAEHVARGDTEKANGAIGTSAGISLCLPLSSRHASHGGSSRPRSAAPSSCASRWRSSTPTATS